MSGTLKTCMPASKSRLVAGAGQVHPVAIWTAFVRQAAWKTWALVFSFALNALLAVAAIGFANKTPDVVLVDSTSGKSTYVNASVAGNALLQFLHEQQHRPTDVTVVHFTTEFLKAFLGLSAPTAEESWAEALAMMAPELAGRLSEEAKARRILETYREAGIQTALRVDDVEVVERHGALVRVRATVQRARISTLHRADESTETLQVEIVERMVLRAPRHPDGLEVFTQTVSVLACEGSLCARKPATGSAL